jgi:hypothetical protein
MAGSVKTLTVCTAAGLVLVTAYTVALGASAWLWFAWAALVLVTLGAFAARRR